VHNVALEGIRDPVRVLRAEAIENRRAVEDDDVGRDRLVALDRRVGILARA
jgi:hypothetical protein